MLLDFTNTIQQIKYRSVYDSHILAVAVFNPEYMQWCVYIGSVPGLKHDFEWPKVRSFGSLLPETMARFLFQNISTEYSYSEDL